MVLVASLGGTSGAHFNPAVTVTLGGLRKISPPDAVIYILLQLAGAVAAALVAKALLKDEGKLVNYGAPSVSFRVTDFGAFIGEVIGTFDAHVGDHGRRGQPARTALGRALGHRRGAGRGRDGLRAADRRQPQPGARLRARPRQRRVRRLRHVPARLRPRAARRRGAGRDALPGDRPAAAGAGGGLEDVAVGPKGEIIIGEDEGLDAPGRAADRQAGVAPDRVQRRATRAHP